MSVRTVTLPTDPNEFWEFFAWPAKAPGDSLPYQLDCKAWLADGNFTLDSVDVSASPGLTVSDPILSGSGNEATLITVQIAGGAPDTIATVAFTLHLDSGTLVVRVALEIEDSLPDDLEPVGSLPANALVWGSEVLTWGGQTLTWGP